MRQKSNKIFIYAGLLLLFVAFAVKWTGCSDVLFWILLGMAIVFKVTFLISLFRAKDFKPDLGFCLILTGVVMILLFLIFRELSLASVLQKILFYVAISLKVSGLIIMICRKKRMK
jgi:hypothetical protein